MGCDLLVLAMPYHGSPKSKSEIIFTFLHFCCSLASRPGWRVANAARSRGPIIPADGTMIGEVFWLDDKIWHKQVMRLHEVRTIRCEASQ
jgi:hypothetical protein